MLFGRGMLYINPKILRSLSSEMRSDNRGSVPDILYLEHRYTQKYHFELSLTASISYSQLEKKTYFAMRESFTTIALLKMTVKSTGSKMCRGDSLCLRATFQSLSVPHRNRSLSDITGGLFVQEIWFYL